MNLKLWFLRLRDKMLVFVRCVKKCLQNGHSCRLAGVWLKCQNLRFACAVNRFCSSRGKKHSNSEHHDFQSSQANIHPSIFFLLLEASVPECFLATQRPQTPTRRHNDAMSNSKPKSTFFLCTSWIFLWSMGIGLKFLKCFHVPSICWIPATMVLWDLLTNHLENDKS